MYKDVGRSCYFGIQYFRFSEFTAGTGKFDGNVGMDAKKRRFSAMGMKLNR